MKKLAVLSNINIDPLQNQLHKYNLYELYFSGYNQWQSDLLNLNSNLYIFKPNFIFIYLNADEFKLEIEDLFSAIVFFKQTMPTCEFIVSNFTSAPYRVETYKPIEKAERKLNASLEQFAKEQGNVFILDFERLVLLHGHKNLFSDKFWYLGRIKFSNPTFTILATEIHNLLNAIMGKSKKVLVIDLDNTVWGGIVGEDGWQGLQLGEESNGLIYKDFQQTIKRLAEQGIMLAICSKNNEHEVIEAFKNNTAMVLNLNDFVSTRINWTPKPENIINIAQELNVGLDSIVFIDDSAFEREFVKTELPEVTVPEFPTDISKLTYWFVNDVIYPYFAKTDLTTEDLDKTNQYKRNTLREKEKTNTNYDNYIKGLEIETDIRIADQSAYKRIAQLSQKTNQFNLSLKLYSESEIEILCKKNEFNAYICSYKDKYGNEGIVGCAITEKRTKTIFIDSLYVSCRALGREVESTFLAKIIEISLSENPECNCIEAIFNSNNRNEQVKEFLIKNNFKSIDNNLYRRIIK